MATDRRSSLPQASLFWTDAQSRTLLLGLVLFVAWLGWERWTQPVEITEPAASASAKIQSTDPSQALAVDDKLDPNTATAAMLSNLPSLGVKRAAMIVAYRTGAIKTRPNQRAFARPADLMRIKGFGAATVEKLSPYLRFDSTRPSE